MISDMLSGPRSPVDPGFPIQTERPVVKLIGFMSSTVCHLFGSGESNVIAGAEILERMSFGLVTVSTL